MVLQCKVFRLLFIVLALLSVTLLARDPRGSGFIFVEEPLNPRLTAMGGAGTAVGAGGFSYYNPAQPFFTGVPYVSVEFGQISGDLNKGGAETAIITSRWFAGLNFSTQTIDFQTATERGPGEMDSQQGTLAALTLGTIRDDFALALALNGLQDRIGYSNTYHALSASAGIAYRVIPGRLNFGAAGFHAGRNRSSMNDSLGITRFVRAGVSYEERVREIPFTVAADVVYRDETAEFLFPVGVEVRPLPMLAIRAGKRIGHPTDVFSAGVGLDTDNLSFDVSFVTTKLVRDYGMKWSAGVSYYLRPRPTTHEFKPMEIKADYSNGQKEQIEETLTIERQEKPVRAEIHLEEADESVEAEEKSVQKMQEKTLEAPTDLQTDEFEAAKSEYEEER
ncbi:hypothetical protein QA601_08030 [Chitinispirillales bacterium ANBcel5]|uniref:hypothetical protein n=1 Tax=Cellulosispirillum alkaliphilum TaxID=3039283 RepID=UPI002A521B39|nr:hypothetical protein [Chitinispirillales bacterium ANBcel5]